QPHLENINTPHHQHLCPRVTIAPTRVTEFRSTHGQSSRCCSSETFQLAEFRCTTPKSRSSLRRTAVISGMHACTQATVDN
ncbi:hypothetical protein LH612_33190, partial [Klebsiella pneumoniae]|nr:hypothetical protein [Klebsiella pneumoniae]